jgi:hypothetical protein
MDLKIVVPLTLGSLCLVAVFLGAAENNLPLTLLALGMASLLASWSCRETVPSSVEVKVGWRRGKYDLGFDESAAEAARTQSGRWVASDEGEERWVHRETTKTRFLPTGRVLLALGALLVVCALWLQVAPRLAHLWS